MAFHAFKLSTHALKPRRDVSEGYLDPHLFVVLLRILKSFTSALLFMLSRSKTTSSNYCSYSPSPSVELFYGNSV